MLRIKACRGEIYRCRKTGRWGFGVAWIKLQTKPSDSREADAARREIFNWRECGVERSYRELRASSKSGELYACRGTNSPVLLACAVRIAGEFLMRQYGRCFCYFTNNEDSISTLRNAPECDQSRDSCSFVVAVSLSAGEPRRAQCTRNIQSSLASLLHEMLSRRIFRWATLSGSLEYLGA